MLLSMNAPLYNSSAFPVAVMRENQAQIEVIREAVLWQEYRRAHPEFTDFAKYLVLLEADSLDVVRLRKIEELETRFPVIVRAAERCEREDFKAVMSREHALDWLVLSEFDRMTGLISHFLHTLGTTKYTAPSGKAYVPLEQRDDEHQINQTASNIAERFEYGVVLFFNDQTQAQNLKNLLAEGEQLRHLILTHLPKLTLYSERMTPLTENYKKFAKLITPVQVRGSPEIITIHNLILCALVRYLEPSFGEDTAHPNYGKRFSISFPEIPGTDRRAVTIEYRTLSPVPESALQQAANELHKRSYYIGTQYGDFSLPSREGQNHLVELLRLVNTCEVIETQFLSPLSRGTPRNTFDTSEYSSRTLEIFIRGIYELSVSEQLTLELLPELYSLFFKLGCRYEPLGLELNQYLADHLDSIEQPVKFVKSLVKQIGQTSKLIRFNEQLNKITRELNGELVLTSDEIDELIDRVILPGFDTDFNTDRSPKATASFGTDFLEAQIRDVYIGMYSFKTKEGTSCRYSVSLQITQRLGEIISEKYPKYPFDYAQVDFTEEMITFTVHRLPFPSDLDNDTPQLE
jgi:hypothetical protein